MWSGVAPMQASSLYGQAQPAQQHPQQKHDIFVGNLAFHTTEEQLHQAFSEIGRVLKVRLVTDSETGKPRGFAFVEFEDPQAALSAIRNMNDYELNGRRLRVNFSNSSHLEALAGKLGMDLSQQTSQRAQNNAQQQETGAGTQAVADSLKSMPKGEMYDVIAKLKEIADRDPDEARRIISGHPQLPEAILFLMSKLDMVKTPITTSDAAPSVLSAVATTPAPRVDPRSRVADPRTTAADPRASKTASAVAAAAAAAPPPPRADPRTQRVDPRTRNAASAPPTSSVPPPPILQHPPPPPQQASYINHMQPQPQAPPQPPQPPQPIVANLDPSLVQQVMSLTPQQISQLPPDKQQSILALRQQIAGGGM